MPKSFAKFCATLAWIAFAVSSCTSSGLTGGSAPSKGAKKEDSSKTGGQETSTGSSKNTSTGTGDDIGSNDAGDFAEPQDIAGGYLTCRYVDSAPGSATFGCGVARDGVRDDRVLSSVTQGTLLGQEANQIATLSAEVNATDPTQLLIKLATNGQTLAARYLKFSLAVSLKVGDEALTLESPFDLYVPQVVYRSLAEAGYECLPTNLPDGRTFLVCPKFAGSSGSVDIKWSRLPGTVVTDYATYMAPETAGNECLVSQKQQATFAPCACEGDDNWIEGTFSLPGGTNPFPPHDLCFAVETQTEIFGKPQTIIGVTPP